MKDADWEMIVKVHTQPPSAVGGSAILMHPFVFLHGMPFEAGRVSPAG